MSRWEIIGLGLLALFMLRAIWDVLVSKATGSTERQRRQERARVYREKVTRSRRGVSVTHGIRIGPFYSSTTRKLD